MQPTRTFANNNIGHKHYHHMGDNFMDFEAAFEMSDNGSAYLNPGTISYDMAQRMHDAYIKNEPISVRELAQLWMDHARRQSPRTMTNAYAKVMPDNKVGVSYVARVNDMLDTWCKSKEFDFPERLQGVGLDELVWMPV